MTILCMIILMMSSCYSYRYVGLLQEKQTIASVRGS